MNWEGCEGKQVDQRNIIVVISFSTMLCVGPIFRVIKSRRMRLAGHVARMGRREASTGFWWGNLRVIDQMGDPDVDGRIIL